MAYVQLPKSCLTVGHCSAESWLHFPVREEPCAEHTLPLFTLGVDFENFLPAMGALEVENLECLLAIWPAPVHLWLTLQYPSY